MLGAERRHRSARSIDRATDDRESDTWINGLICSRHHSTQPEVSPQAPGLRHRCPDTEPSPKSCGITQKVVLSPLTIERMFD